MKLSHSNYLQLAFVTNHRLQLRAPGVASSIRNVKTLLASKGLKMTQLSVVTSRIARLGSFCPFDLEIFIEGKMWIFFTNRENFDFSQRLDLFCFCWCEKTQVFLKKVRPFHEPIH